MRVFVQHACMRATCARLCNMHNFAYPPILNLFRRHIHHASQMSLMLTSSQLSSLHIARLVSTYPTSCRYTLYIYNEPFLSPCYRLRLIKEWRPRCNLMGEKRPFYSHANKIIVRRISKLSRYFSSVYRHTAFVPNEIFI